MIFITARELAGGLGICIHLVEARVGIAGPGHGHFAVSLAKAGFDGIVLQMKYIKLFRKKNTQGCKT